MAQKFKMVDEAIAKRGSNIDGINALKKLVELYQKHPNMRETIVEYAQVEGDFIVLAELSKVSGEVKQILIGMADRGIAKAADALAYLPGDKEVEEALVAISKKPASGSVAIPAIERLLARDSSNRVLRDAIMEMNRKIPWQGVHGVAILARSGDVEAQKRLAEVADMPCMGEAIDEICFSAQNGDSSAKKLLFEISETGNSTAIGDIKALAYQGDEESLEQLFRLATTKNDSEEHQYGITFSVRALIGLLIDDMGIGALGEEKVERIIAQINALGRCGDYEVLAVVKRELQNVKSEVGRLSYVYPELEQTIKFFVGLPKTGMSIYDKHYGEQPRVTHVTTFRTLPGKKYR